MLELRLSIVAASIRRELPPLGLRYFLRAGGFVVAGNEFFAVVFLMPFMALALRLHVVKAAV
jgi:hypothetical protein